MELDYEQDMYINAEALDIEWLNQPSLMRKYTKHAAEMKREMDEAKERFETARARIDMEIRTDPESHGLAKVTEGAIQSTILLKEEYQQLSQAYINARYEYDIAIGAVRAIDQRKTALEELVRLLSASYFAGPVTPRDLSKERMQEEENKKINNKIKIKRRSE